jgi:hypothetical protein
MARFKLSGWGRVKSRVKIARGRAEREKSLAKALLFPTY